MTLAELPPIPINADPDFVYRKQVIGNKVYLAVDPATQSLDDTIVVAFETFGVIEPCPGFSAKVVDRARAERRAVESRIGAEARHLGGRGFARAMAEYEAKMELLEADLKL